jgi:uncharacterized membrane protein YadS
MTLPLVDIVLRIALVIATGILFTVVFAAYLRLRNRKLLFLSTGFGIFFAHAIIYIPELFGPTYIIDENTHLVIHLVALFFILLSTLKD